MNDTKWEELRLAMYRIEPLPPAWRTRCVENGYVSPWDREWFYHFRDGGYGSIEWVEIKPDSAEHLPGLKTDNGFRILGYATPGDTI
ncbi:MAG: hypothetical protein HOV81_39835 [Kofleriaceae bacterium]|nr:hypothetical protein [Kofleriaceae bacterium]